MDTLVQCGRGFLINSWVDFVQTGEVLRNLDFLKWWAYSLTCKSAVLTIHWPRSAHVLLNDMHHHILTCEFQHDLPCHKIGQHAFPVQHRRQWHLPSILHKERSYIRPKGPIELVVQTDFAHQKFYRLLHAFGGIIPLCPLERMDFDEQGGGDCHGCFELVSLVKRKTKKRYGCVLYIDENKEFLIGRDNF